MGAMMERQVLTITLTVEAHPQYLDQIEYEVEDALANAIGRGAHGTLTGFVATKGEIS